MVGKLSLALTRDFEGMRTHDLLRVQTLLLLLLLRPTSWKVCVRATEMKTAKITVRGRVFLCSRVPTREAAAFLAGHGAPYSRRV